MSIEQTQTVDAISVDHVRKEVCLSLTDHLDWAPGAELRHLQLLKDKINTYVYFIESGQLRRDVDFPLNYAVVIRVVSQCPYPEQSAGFKQAVSEVLNAAGHRIEFLTIEELEHIYRKRVH